MADDASIERTVVSVVAQWSGTNPWQISRATRFIDDLGCDSVAMLDLYLRLEAELTERVASRLWVADAITAPSTVGELMDRLDEDGNAGTVARIAPHPPPRGTQAA